MESKHLLVLIWIEARRHHQDRQTSDVMDLRCKRYLDFQKITLPILKLGPASC